MKDLENVVIGCMDTDGTDGPTIYAGGIVDSSTIDYAEAEKIDIYKGMDEYNDSLVLKNLGDIIFSGGTGTNVNDISVLLIKNEEEKTI